MTLCARTTRLSRRGAALRRGHGHVDKPVLNGGIQPRDVGDGEKVEDDTRPRAGENDLPRKVIFISLTFVGNC